jgi:putative hydrolase of the HAD superfamily
MLKAVIFDLYETLVTELEPDWKPPKFSIAERLGISETDFKKYAGPLRDRWDEGRLKTYKDYLLALCGSVGHTPRASVVAELTLEMATRKSIVFDSIDPGIVEMVKDLRSRGLRLCVVSNASDMDVEPWPRCELAPLFDAFIPSYQVGILKPDPRIYELGLQALGVSAEEAIFVGDGGSNELPGAARVGLRAYFATWFLDRWPPGIRQLRYANAGWHDDPEGEPPFPRLRSPRDLLDIVGSS